MTWYEKHKSLARAKAQRWQVEFAHKSLCYSTIVAYNKYFTTIGKQFGLLKEFRENGII